MKTSYPIPKQAQRQIVIIKELAEIGREHMTDRLGRLEANFMAEVGALREYSKDDTRVHKLLIGQVKSTFSDYLKHRTQCRRLGVSTTLYDRIVRKEARYANKIGGLNLRLT